MSWRESSPPSRSWPDPLLHGQLGGLGQCFAKQMFALWYWRLDLQHEQQYCTTLVLARDLGPSGTLQWLSLRSVVGGLDRRDPDAQVCVHGPAKDKPCRTGLVRWPEGHYMTAS